MRNFIRHIGNKGLSAIELLLALLIAAILIGAAMPSFMNMIASSRIDGGARQVLYEIRSTQSLAINRGGVFGFHWGGDPGPPPAGQLNSTYRIVRDTTGACGFPAVGAPVDNTNVIRGWWDLAGDYRGVTIQTVQDANNTTIGGVMFNSRGASVNTCAAVAFPVTIIIADNSGAQRCVDVQRAGRVSVRSVGVACP
ncbi:MAG: Tfp pilus assembly protein FimT/FimU [Candidatus Methylomirabilales bacterium]